MSKASSREPNSRNIIQAFTEDQVERLTGVTRTQLRYWDRTGFFKPSLGSDNRRDPYSRIYSFKDVASLRVLNVLRNQYNVPLQHLRKVASTLADLSDAKWTAVALYVLNKRVVFLEPGTKKYREVVQNQYVLGIPLAAVVKDTERDVAELQARDKAKVGKVERARNVSHNKPVVAGTRIPIASIKRLRDDGFSIDQILKEYPTLTPADVQSALAFESDGLAA